MISLFLPSLFLLPLVSGHSVSTKECPKYWQSHQDSCYRFVRSQKLNLENARLFCQDYQSRLISVNNLEEHNFIVDYLRQNDPQHLVWFTSGEVDSVSKLWKWTGDRTSFTLNQLLITTNETYFDDVKYAAYNFSEPNNKWVLVRVSNYGRNAFICELKKIDIHRLFMTTVDVDYGSNELDPNKIARGPVIDRLTEHIVYDANFRSRNRLVQLICRADAYPAAKYRWYHDDFINGEYSSKYVDPLSDVRYTQMDGVLIISNPNQTIDEGVYHCEASNTHGVVISDEVKLNFGFIGEFNKFRSPETAYTNYGFTLSCLPPLSPKQSLIYQWNKDAFGLMVESNSNVFKSHDGNLYFSSISLDDRGNYSCSVNAKHSNYGQKGPVFHMDVQSKPDFQKLTIFVGFPKAFPEAPMIGDHVVLECVAYGYPVPTYNWTRLGETSEMPISTRYASNGRELIISKVKIEDSGSYMCTADNGFDLINRTIKIEVQSKPLFVVPLVNQVVAHGDEVKFECEAFGIPEVTYSWYKNGVELKVLGMFVQNNDMRYMINNKTLTISYVDSGDAGMYQCRASNSLGWKMSTAQLRITSIKPNFNRHPQQDLYAAIGSTVVIPCAPEAVPRASIDWFKEDFQLSPSGRFRILPSGFLQITSVDRGDEGTYKCLAKNKYGTDRSRSYLTVFNPPRTVLSPKSKIMAFINTTIEMPCEAHVEPTVDIAFVWLHNDLKIDVLGENQYSVGRYPGYLMIANLTFGDSGNYTCQAMTTIGTVEAHSELIIEGPPNSPGAVLVDNCTSQSAIINWSDGYDNGRRILSYKIEGKTNHNDTWIVLSDNVTEYSVNLDNNRKNMPINGLSPYNVYEIRLSARNELGMGQPSVPSPQFQTASDRPHRAPTNVGGGGGKSGMLTIMWDPLKPQDWNAESIWYKVYYREVDDRSDDFISRELKSLGNVGRFVVNVGLHNFYKKYMVRVQAINPIGEGPVSNVSEIYSAESMPQIQPSGVYAEPFNSTALNVSWSPIDPRRESLRGKLIGFRIKYWRVSDLPTEALILLSKQKDASGQLKNNGIIVGLSPNTEYKVAVMAYNEAGSSPESEPFSSFTYRAAPKNAPTDVHIEMNTRTSVRVTWTGISTGSDEEPILGYKVRYWEGEQMVNYKQVQKPLTNMDDEMEVIVTGLAPGNRYKLRVLAYSLGGDGRMSAPIKDFQISN